MYVVGFFRGYSKRDILNCNIVVLKVIRIKVVMRNYERKMEDGKGGEGRRKGVG